jgi:hypothetical protein
MAANKFAQVGLAPGRPLLVLAKPVAAGIEPSAETKGVLDETGAISQCVA